MTRAVGPYYGSEAARNNIDCRSAMHDPRSSYAAAYLLIRMLPSLRDKRFRRRDILSVVNRLSYGAGARAAPQTRKIIDVPTTSIIDYVLDGLRLVKRSFALERGVGA